MWEGAWGHISEVSVLEVRLQSELPSSSCKSPFIVLLYKLSRKKIVGKRKFNAKWRSFSKKRNFKIRRV